MDSHKKLHFIFQCRPQYQAKLGLKEFSTFEDAVSSALKEKQEYLLLKRAIEEEAKQPSNNRNSEPLGISYNCESKDTGTDYYNKQRGNKPQTSDNYYRNKSE